MFLPLLVGAAVSGVATAGNLLQYYRQQLGPMTLAEARLLIEGPVTPIAQAVAGVVKIVGEIGTDHPEVALHGAMPVAVREVHHYTVEGSGVNARKVLARVERTPHAFWIQDASGRITLDPAKVRIDFECEGADGESLVEEYRLRVGERVAILGEVERVETMAAHPLRQAPVLVGQGLTFVGSPVVTWRTEPEVHPRFVPPMGGVALSAGTVGLAVLGAILRL